MVQLRRVKKGLNMEHRERIKLDRGFVEEQIPLTKTIKELADKCGCGKDKMRHFLYDNGLYKLYCETHNIEYDPSKENRKCSICGYDKDVRYLYGQLYCKRHYNQIFRYGEPVERTIYTSNDIITEGETSKIIMRDKYQNVIGESLIDTEDIEKIKDYKWYLGTGGYCITKSINPETGIDMANVIFDNFKESYDHISHDRLDNRKVNLRPVTQHQNAMNMGKKNTNTSGVTGVSKLKSNGTWKGKWQATLTYNYQPIWLGGYWSFDEAVHARLKGEIEYFGEYSPNYNSETQTIQLEYINPDTNVKHYVEYNLRGELLSDSERCIV